MITPEQLNEIPESFVQEIEELENYIIADIARRIAKEGEITDTAAMEVNRALELGADISVIERFIERVTGAMQEDIDIVLRGVIKESVDADNVIYKAAGYNPVDLKKSSKLVEIIEAGIRQTNSTLKNITGSMGFASVVGGKTVFQDIAKFYQNTLDFALLQVSTGVLDVNSAARFAVKKMADSGIRYVDYASGHVNRVDVAIKRAILTGVNQLNLRLTDSIMEELGAEYVEVTAHAGARPDHAVWQGKVYHRGGEKDGYPDFESSTGYGTGPGLGGWNCRHSYFPFFPGISARSYTDEQLENIDPPNFTYKGKEYTYYEATQKQRQMETQMRKTKRELVGFDAFGMKDDFTAASIRLNNQKREYRKFSKAAGLRPKFERAEEYGFTKSISQKSVWANRKKTKIDLKMGAKSGALTDAEIGAINRYISSDSYILNEKLRNGIKLTAEQERWKRDLDYAIVKLPKFKGTVYRSLSLQMIWDIETFNSKYSAGKFIIEPAYTSASTKIYDEMMDIQFIIESKGGCDMRKYNQMENEILFRRGSRFFVTKREGYKIWLTEI